MQEYSEEALSQLKADFRQTSVNTIRAVFKNRKCHYFPAWNDLMGIPPNLQGKRYMRECKVKVLQLRQEVRLPIIHCNNR